LIFQQQPSPPIIVKLIPPEQKSELYGRDVLGTIAILQLTEVTEAVNGGGRS
jgi:hypothetical protein